MKQQINKKFSLHLKVGKEPDMWTSLNIAF